MTPTMMPRCRRLGLAGGALGLSVAASATLAGGPPVITSLVLEGDAVSGAGLVTLINNIAVNDSGDWLVEVDTDAATDGVALIRNGSVIINEGDSMPATPPRATLSSFDSITINNAGESGYNFFLDNTGATTNDSGVYFGPGVPPFNPALVYQESEEAPLLTPGTPFIGFFDVKINNNRQVMVMASVDDKAILSTVDRALYVHQLDAAGAITATTLIGKEGDVPAGQTETIADFLTGPHGSAINDAGDAMYCVDLTGDMLEDLAIYRNSSILAQEGSPSPIAGRHWTSLTSSRMDLTGNHYVHTGTLSGDATTDAVIARNGAIFRQEGDTLPAIGGVFTFTAFGSGPVEVSSGGDVLWFGDWNDPDLTRDTGLFLNDQLLIQEGVTVIEGQTVLSLSGVEDGYHMSTDGSKIIVELTLVGGTNGAFLIELAGAPCPANIVASGASATQVDIDDLLAVISAWGPCPAPPAPCPANIATSGASATSVDIDDLLAVISGWGPCS